MGNGRNIQYNSRTRKYTRPKAWYDKKNSGSNSGCYVATAVYGSYDCPEVWTLRRYRDEHLSKSLLGQLFIKVYYAVSPTIVKFFGKKKWFNMIFKGELDKMVKELNNKGYASSRYKDPE